MEPSSVFQLLSPGKVPKNPIETRLEATPVKPWCRVLNFTTFGTGCVQKRIHVDVCVFCEAIRKSRRVYCSIFCDFSCLFLGVFIQWFMVLAQGHLVPVAFNCWNFPDKTFGVIVFTFSAFSLLCTVLSKLFINYIL